MDPQGFSENSRLRASDADRDRAAGVVSTAMAEGRLTPDEHAERLDAIYSAKTHADIAPLIDDLPGSAAAAPVPMSGEVVGPDSVDRIVAVFSSATRKGSWQVEPVIDILTVFGGAQLDFREALLPAREITLRAVCVLGGVEIIVPPEMRVVDAGVAILGAREITGSGLESAPPDAPVLRITGACVLGGLEVKRRRRRRDRTDRKSPVIRIQ